MKKYIFSILIILFTAASFAESNVTTSWYSENGGDGVTINVQAFVSSTCPHCHGANLFLDKIEKEFTWVKVHRYVINNDELALKYFYQQLKIFNTYDFSVPTVMFCGSRWTGFIDEKVTGMLWLQAFKYCRSQIEENGGLDKNTQEVLKHWSVSSEFTDKDALGSSEFSIVFSSAILAAYSPCALFCFALFLSYIWMCSKNKKLQFLVGVSFIVILGICSAAQQLYTNEYLEILPNLRIFSILVGFLLLLLMGSCCWPNFIRPLGGSSLFIFPVIIFSVIVVYMYQQTCGLNFGVVYEQWLYSINLTPTGYFLYRSLYLLFYLSSLFILLLFYLVFGVRPEKLLRNTGCIYISSIGLMLILQPSLLSNLFVSVIMFITAMPAAWLFNRITR